MENAFEVRKNANVIAKITKDGQISDVSGKLLSLTSQKTHEFQASSTDTTISVGVGCYLVFAQNPFDSYGATQSVYAINNYNGGVYAAFLGGQDVLTFTNVGTNSQLKIKTNATFGSLVKIIKLF